MIPTYWNQDPYTEKTFSKPFVPHSYSYRDYQMAWFNAIWYQNFEHSWFIKFCQNAHKIHYPFWVENFWISQRYIPWIFQIKEKEDQIKQVFKTIKIKWWDKYTYTHADIKAVEV